jgi:hypothetical protein
VRAFRRLLTARGTVLFVLVFISGVFLVRLG